ncbi:hypothetical protein RSAG8_05269, partial [Rhizoctonia solani AG-8 WAC10335]
MRHGLCTRCDRESRVLHNTNQLCPLKSKGDIYGTRVDQRVVVSRFISEKTIGAPLFSVLN